MIDIEEICLRTGEPTTKWWVKTYFTVYYLARRARMIDIEEMCLPLTVRRKGKHTTKWWAKTYFTVFFDRDMWFSKFFIFLYVVMLLNIIPPGSRFQGQLFLYILSCIGSLLILAAAFAATAMLHVFMILRIEKEREQEQPISPWFLGGWVEHLERR